LKFVARQAVTLQGLLPTLHPSYDDCPTPCALTAEDERPRDLPAYCGQCDVAKQLEFFESAARHELARRFEEGECLWSFEQLERDVFEAMRLARLFDHYPPDVEALTARAIDVVRREQGRPDRVRAWERAQKRDSSDV
jgi:hypothetical protein